MFLDCWRKLLRKVGKLIDVKKKKTKTKNNKHQLSLIRQCQDLCNPFSFLNLYVTERDKHRKFLSPLYHLKFGMVQIVLFPLFSRELKAK